MLSRFDRGGRDVSRGGVEVDCFVGPSPALNTAPVEDRRQCAAGLSASRSAGDALHPERSQRSGRPAPRRMLRAGHLGSRLDGESDSEAKEFAHRVVRCALEVLDRHRPVAQLGHIADPAVVSVVRTVIKGGFVPGAELGTAVLRRVDVVMVNGAAAEVCASYDRGHRHFALAARIARTRAGWRLTALRVL